MKEEPRAHYDYTRAGNCIVSVRSSIGAVNEQPVPVASAVDRGHRPRRDREERCAEKVSCALPTQWPAGHSCSTVGRSSKVNQQRLCRRWCFDCPHGIWASAKERREVSKAKERH